MYKKLTKIVKGAMVIYIIYLVFPDELKLIGQSIIMIIKGGVMWIIEASGDAAKESISNAVSNSKDAILNWLKSLNPWGGK